MDNDDAPTGRILNRREALALLGTAGITLFSGSPFPGSARAGDAPRPLAGAVADSLGFRGPCIVRPEMTEGPFFVDEKLNRSDIRSDPSDGEVRPGVPLDLSFNVSGVSGDRCAPLSDYVVDVWHCDAQGVYSDVMEAEGQKFLRGYQMTDAKGRATFRTIVPGWYPGRAVHIHFKIRSTLSGSPAHEFTSQIFFPDDFNDRVLATSVYRKEGRRVLNARDGIYRHDGGSELLLTPVKEGEVYAAALDIALAGV